MIEMAISVDEKAQKKLVKSLIILGFSSGICINLQKANEGKGVIVWITEVVERRSTLHPALEFQVQN